MGSVKSKREAESASILSPEHFPSSSSNPLQPSLMLYVYGCNDAAALLFRVTAPPRVVLRLGGVVINAHPSLLQSV